MAYVPPKAKRQYQQALWEKKKDGTKGRLVVHDCAKCKKTFDGTEPGAWFERADQRGVWVWVCLECRA